MKRLFLPINLQFFAAPNDGAGGAGGNDGGEPGGNNPDNPNGGQSQGADGSGDNGDSEPNPRTVAKYSDDDVDAIIDSKFAKWQKEQEEKAAKEKSRSQMSPEERRAAELDEREAELTQRTIRLDYQSRIKEDNLSEGILELIDYSSVEQAEKTYNTIKSIFEEMNGDFEKRLADGIKQGVEERLAGPRPLGGNASASSSDGEYGKELATRTKAPKPSGTYFKKN